MSFIPCPGCSKPVAEMSPACPDCGEKIYVEHPADMKRARHRVLVYPDESHQRNRRPESK